MHNFVLRREAEWPNSRQLSSFFSIFITTYVHYCAFLWLAQSAHDPISVATYFWQYQFFSLKLARYCWWIVWCRFGPILSGLFKYELHFNQKTFWFTDQKPICEFSYSGPCWRTADCAKITETWNCWPCAFKGLEKVDMFYFECILCSSWYVTRR